ncbi:high mobility group box domain-containing protein [Mycotypha africana]|uniref:high mobility group box domain-containing protein n=1 Tax=Mycotypha africana TaxID=64632 RepID=UPI00230109DA|nr:high mobility group box domain-containing protein [Mycotypha africana]KAI8984505.1 high mobility group box domain-containing protein [Mycotypha africana]
MTEDSTYKQKYKDIRKRILEIEQDNDALNIKILKARKSIRHLKMERNFLLNRIEKSNGVLDHNIDESDLASDIYSHDEIGNMSHKLQITHHKREAAGGGGRGGKSAAANKLPRKKKDPNAPKGPGNVFFLYCRFERDKMKDQYPTENLGEVTRLLGQQWKALTKEQKKVYYDMYRREQEEYAEAMKTYTFNKNINTVETNDDHTSDLHDATDSNMVSVVSSPTHSTEVSVDFPSDDLHHQDSPEADTYNVVEHS